MRRCVGCGAFEWDGIETCRQCGESTGADERVTPELIAKRTILRNKLAKDVSNFDLILEAAAIDGALGLHDAAVRLLEDRLRLTNDARLVGLLARSLPLARTSDVALVRLLVLADEYPKSADVHVALALLHIRSGQQERARAALSGVDLSGVAIETLEILAASQCEANLDTEAIATCAAIIKRQPSAFAWTTLGEAHLRRRDRASALRAFREGLRIEPGYPRAGLLLSTEMLLLSAEILGAGEEAPADLPEISNILDGVRTRESTLSGTERTTLELLSVAADAKLRRDLTSVASRLDRLDPGSMTYSVARVYHQARYDVLVGALEEGVLRLARQAMSRLERESLPSDHVSRLVALAKKFEDASSPASGQSLYNRVELAKELHARFSTSDTTDWAATALGLRAADYGKQKHYDLAIRDLREALQFRRSPDLEAADAKFRTARQTRYFKIGAASVAIVFGVASVLVWWFLYNRGGVEIFVKNADRIDISWEAADKPIEVIGDKYESGIVNINKIFLRASSSNAIYAALEEEIDMPHWRRVEPHDFELPKRLGSLRVSTDPSEIDVTIVSAGENKICRTPCEINGIYAIESSLLFSINGVYRHSVKISILQDQTVDTGTISLWGKLSVTSEPRGADLSIDGMKVGVTPYSGNVLPGRRAVALTMDGYARYEQNIDVETNKTLNLDSIKLEYIAARQSRAEAEPKAQEAQESNRFASEVHGTSADPREPWLNVRARPDANAPIQARLRDGERVRVVRDAGGGWIEIEVSSGADAGRRGYAKSRWLRLIN